eukprot:UN01787
MPYEPSNQDNNTVTCSQLAPNSSKDLHSEENITTPSPQQTNEHNKQQQQQQQQQQDQQVENTTLHSPTSQTSPQPTYRRKSFIRSRRTSHYDNHSYEPDYVQRERRRRESLLAVQNHVADGGDDDPDNQHEEVITNRDMNQIAENDNQL